MITDTHLVRTEELRDVLVPHVLEHRRSRPRRQRALGRVGAIQWLAAASGVAESTVDSILRARTVHCALWQADALLVAVGEPHALADGRISVLSRRDLFSAGRAGVGKRRAPQADSSPEGASA